MARKKIDVIKNNDDLARVVLGATLCALIGPMLLYPIGARLRQIIELVMDTTIKLERGEIA